MIKVASCPVLLNTWSIFWNRSFWEYRNPFIMADLPKSLSMRDDVDGGERFAMRFPPDKSLLLPIFITALHNAHQPWSTLHLRTGLQTCWRDKTSEQESGKGLFVGACGGVQMVWPDRKVGNWKVAPAPSTGNLATNWEGKGKLALLSNKQIRTHIVIWTFKEKKYRSYKDAISHLQSDCPVQVSQYGGQAPSTVSPYVRPANPLVMQPSFLIYENK